MLVAAMERKNQIAEILKAKNDMSIYRLAQRAGLNYKTTHKLVNSATIPPDTRYGTLLQVATVLGVKIDDLEK